MHDAVGPPLLADLRRRTAVMVADVGALVRVESPSDDVRACGAAVEAAALVAASCLPRAARVERHAGRDVLLWGPDRPRVLLLGHLDTVWPLGTSSRLPWRVEGDVMRGPGVFDMKAGVVVALHAIAAVTAAGGDDVGLLLTTDEEIESPSSRALIAALAAGAEAVLVCEPSVDGSLKSARKGTSRYTARITGRAAHAGLEPERGVNALLGLARLAPAAAAVADPSRGTSVTPTLARAGTTSNTVPDRAELVLDVRAAHPAEQQRVDAAIRMLVDPGGDAPTGGRVEVAWEGGIERPAMPASEQLLRLVPDVCEALGLDDPGHRAVGGASDGNLTAALGVPTLDGLGAVGGGAHADDEWASVAALPERAALVAGLVLTLLPR